MSTSRLPSSSFVLEKRGPQVKLSCCDQLCHPKSLPCAHTLLHVQVDLCHVPFLLSHDCRGGHGLRRGGWWTIKALLMMLWMRMAGAMQLTSAGCVCRLHPTLAIAARCAEHTPLSLCLKGPFSIGACKFAEIQWPLRDLYLHAQVPFIPAGII